MVENAGAGSRTRIRVLVVDDHRMFADSLCLGIDAQPDLECVGTTSGFDQAVALVERHHPDVVVMDAVLSGTDGIEGTRILGERFPDVDVVIVTDRADAEQMVAAARAGAVAFIPKERPVEHLYAVVRSRDGDRVFAEPLVVAALMTDVETEGVSEERRSELGVLSPREADVLGLLAEGADTGAIARILGISVHTCRGHVKNVLMKLGARSQLQAVVKAARVGMLPDHPLEEVWLRPDDPDLEDDPADS